jgi:ABC-2 type transport system permease protein
LSTGIKNMIRIARKEFQDLINSRLTLIILVGFIVTSLFSFGSIIMTLDHISTDPVKDILDSFTYNFSFYGSLVGIILGFSSISSEFDKNALGNLLVKPLYRDTIINGKMLGFVGLFIGIFTFSAIFYMSFVFVYFGGSSYNAQIAFISSLPLSLILTFLCILFSYSLSMLIYIIIKNQSMALFISFLLWILLFYSLGDAFIVHGIADAIHNDELGNTISSFSPRSMVNYIFQHHDIQSAVIYNGGDLLRLLLYCFIAVIMVYSAFLRSDVA